MGRILRDIPELVATVREQAARCKDLVVANGKAEFDIIEEGKELGIRIDGRGIFGVQKQAHGQIAQKFGEIPKAYYDRMLDKAKSLLVQNLEHWRGSEAKNHLIRLIDADVRAVLSDRYRPISHLDILTTAVQVITGEGAAKGAACFGWNVSPTRMDVCLMNPGIQIDLNHLEKGVQFNQPGGYSPDAPNHGWVRAKGSQDDGAHWVFPSAFLGNSETGHGGYSIETGLYEAICDNTARLGNISQRHLGRTLEEDETLSSATYEKMNAVIFAKTADIMRAAFDPTLLLASAKKMKGLADVEVDVKEAVNSIVKLPGITEGIRDDIFAAYKPLGSRDTLLDVQRAVTAAAHAVRETQYDLSVELERLGGAMIEEGKAALVA
jgi:hypothetical protein